MMQKQQKGMKEEGGERKKERKVGRNRQIDKGNNQVKVAICAFELKP